MNKGCGNAERSVKNYDAYIKYIQKQMEEPFIMRLDLVTWCGNGIKLYWFEKKLSEPNEAIWRKV